MLLLLNIGQEHAPTNDVIILVAERGALVLEPTVVAVVSPQPLHDFAGRPGGKGAGEHLDDMRQVGRIDRRVGPQCCSSSSGLPVKSRRRRFAK